MSENNKMTATQVREEQDKIELAERARLRELSDTSGSTFIKRLAYRPHPNPKIRKISPEEVQVGWEFESRSTGEKRLVSWGSIPSRETLTRIIDEAKERYGITEVVELSE